MLQDGLHWSYRRTQLHPWPFSSGQCSHYYYTNSPFALVSFTVGGLEHISSSKTKQKKDLVFYSCTSWCVHMESLRQRAQQPQDTEQRRSQQQKRQQVCVERNHFILVNVFIYLFLFNIVKPLPLILTAIFSIKY